MRIATLDLISAAFSLSIVSIVGNADTDLAGAMVLGWGTVEDFNLKGMFLAVIGALIVLWLVGMATKRG